MGRGRNEALWATWRDRMERFSQSGLTVNAFCLQEGVSIPSYYQWKRRLSTGPDSTGEPHAPIARFMPVQIKALTNIEVHFSCGTRIFIPGDDHEAIRTVIATLRSVGAENRSC